MMKKIFFFLLIFVLLISDKAFSASDKSYVIDAEMNAALHNTIALDYLKEKYYFGAIKEFQIAIGISPNTQAASVYHINLGKTYMTIGYPELAQNHFETAIKLYPLNFEYYKYLIDSFGKQNILDKKLDYYTKNRKSSLDDITRGLIYGALGNTKTEITILDEFCNNEPDLLITPAVKNFVKEQAQYIKNNKNEAM